MIEHSYFLLQASRLVNRSSYPNILLGRITVAFGKWLRTASSPRAFVTRKREALSFPAPSAETWMSFSTPASRAVFAMFVAPSICTSSREKWLSRILDLDKAKNIYLQNKIIHKSIGEFIFLGDKKSVITKLKRDGYIIQNIHTNRIDIPKIRIERKTMTGLQTKRMDAYRESVSCPIKLITTWECCNDRLTRSLSSSWKG